MECEPAAFQLQVMLSPAAIVSTAGFWVPLWALRKKMLPTETSPTGWPPPPGEVTPPHPASSVAATINGMRRMLRPPCRISRSLRQGLRLTVDEVVHHDEVLGAVRADIGARRAQRGFATRDQDPGDDRGVEYRTDEGEPLSAEMGRRCDAGELDTVRVEILDPRSGRLVDVGEHHPEALDHAVGRGARQLEVDLDLVRADGHEQLRGREGLELVGEAGVDRRKGGAVYPQSCPGGGHQHSPLRVDVEERRREVVDVGQGGGHAVPVDLAPAIVGGWGVGRVQAAAERSAKLVQGVGDREAVALGPDNGEAGPGGRAGGGRIEIVARRQSHKAQERGIDRRFHRVLRRDEDGWLNEGNGSDRSATEKSDEAPLTPGTQRKTTVGRRTT